MTFWSLTWVWLAWMRSAPFIIFARTRSAFHAASPSVIDASPRSLAGRLLAGGVVLLSVAGAAVPADGALSSLPWSLPHPVVRRPASSAMAIVVVAWRMDPFKVPGRGAVKPHPAGAHASGSKNDA